MAAKNIAKQSAVAPSDSAKPVATSDATQRVDQITLSSGGVQAIVGGIKDPSSKDTGKTISFDIEDSATDLANIKVASYDVKANLKVIQAQQKIDQSLLDIHS